MNTPQDSSLGHEVAYPSHYDAGLLFPIPRAAGRAEIGIADGAPGSSPGQALPFIATTAGMPTRSAGWMRAASPAWPPRR